MSSTIEQFKALREELVNELQKLTVEIRELHSRKDELLSVLYQESTETRTVETKFDHEYFQRETTPSGFANPVISVKSEADEVVRTLQGLIEKNGHVTVADLYDLIGVTGRFTDGKYGWTDLSSLQLIENKEGWEIDFPLPTLLTEPTVINLTQNFAEPPKDNDLRKSNRKSPAKKTAAKRNPPAKKTVAKKLPDEVVPEKKALTLDDKLLAFLFENPGSRREDIKKKVRLGRKQLTTVETSNLIKRAKSRGAIENTGGVGKASAWSLTEAGRLVLAGEL